MDDRIRKMREKILTSTDDAALTATELRSKYGKDEEMKPRSPRPSFADAPRQRSFASSSSNLRPSGTPSAFDLDDGCGCGGRISAAGTPSSVAVNGVCVRRCFLCGTTLRDPGVPYFACGACGALNGAEPRIQRAFDGCVFRGMCRSLSKRGRRVVGVVCALIAFVIAAGCRFVLPYVVDPASALSPASARHYALTAFLSLGTVFNYAATVLVGPGHVTTECNPLLPKARASPPKLEVAADDESNPLLQTPVRSSGGDDGANGGGGGGGGKEALARLIVERGEQPLRGWRRCEVTGLSMPPRSHYCRTCKAIVLRMDHHCMFTNSCIGWRNVRRRPRRARGPALAFWPTARSLSPSPSCAQHHYFLCFLAFLLASVLYVGGACVYAATVGLTWMGGLSGATRGATYTPAAYKAAAAAASGGDANATGLELLENLLSSGGIAQPAAAEGLELLLAYRRLSAGDAFGDLEAEFLLLVVCVPTALFAGTLLYIQTKNLLAGLTYIESCRRVPPTEYNNGWRRNVQGVFGAGVGALLVHALPVPRPPVGDGFVFPCRAAERRV